MFLSNAHRLPKTWQRALVRLTVSALPGGPRGFCNRDDAPEDFIPFALAQRMEGAGLVSLRLAPWKRLALTRKGRAYASALVVAAGVRSDGAEADDCVSRPD
jgi:hypothetical protein